MLSHRGAFRPYWKLHSLLYILYGTKAGPMCDQCGVIGSTCDVTEAGLRTCNMSFFSSLSPFRKRWKKVLLGRVFFALVRECIGRNSHWVALYKSTIVITLVYIASVILWSQGETNGLNLLHLPLIRARFCFVRLHALLYWVSCYISLHKWMPPYECWNAEESLNLRQARKSRNCGKEKTGKKSMAKSQ